jgi:AcrR family transcriptional regulator
MINECRVSMMTEAQHLSRAERRTNTEQRILAMARALFADRGFERTTIRAVAAAARVDPALVMQYFGSKQELFSRAIRIAPTETAAAGPAELTELLLASLGMKISELPDTSLAMMRSMLTHPDAADAARATLDQHIEQLSSAIPAEDSRLRAALAVTAILGVTIGHQLLDIGALRGTSAEQIADLLRPCLRALVSGDH